ncbi:MAG TPA: 6-pyruvoyl-tetrahydropterin synthase-related protein [Thermoanaerobaculia bacterium]|nr:6-pyruvoyl-tetrahydropterin synthase-related protein [Thermoanaerobaculia bacterium]
MGYSILQDAGLYNVRHGVLLTGAMLLALLLVGPFFLARRGQETPSPRWLPVPFTHDMRQHLSVLRQLDAAVRTGELYPRWQPEFNKGYGLPWLNYYPPAFYWFAELFYAMTGDPVNTIFIACMLMMVACGVATYVLAREFFSWKASAAAAAMYMLGPYHALDLYWRGALPELAGFFFVPAVLFCAHRAGSTRGARWVAALGLVHGLYLLTHIPVAYLMTVTLTAYAVAWAAMQCDVRIALRIAAGVAWAFAASAVYWLVAVLEKKHVSETFSFDFPYHTSYVVLAGSEGSARLDATFVALAAAVAAAWLMSGAQTLAQHRLFRAFAAGTLFMVTPYSMYFARLIPNINSVSFAWRWFVLVECFLALLAAMCIDRLRTARRLYAVLFAASLAFLLFTTVRLMLRAFDEPNLDAIVSYVETGFVPGRAGDPFQLPDDTPPAALAPAGGTVDVVKWAPLRREVMVTTPRECILLLRTYRFRGWTARVDGRRVELGMDQYGAQLLRVLPGRHRVVVTFENPRTRNALAILSALALLAACVITFRAERRRPAGVPPP